MPLLQLDLGVSIDRWPSRTCPGVPADVSIAEVEQYGRLIAAAMAIVSPPAGVTRYCRSYRYSN